MGRPPPGARSARTCRAVARSPCLRVGARRPLHRGAGPRAQPAPSSRRDLSARHRGLWTSACRESLSYQEMAATSASGRFSSCSIRPCSISPWVCFLRLALQHLGHDEAVRSLGLVAAAELELVLFGAGLDDENAGCPKEAAAFVHAAHRGQLAKWDAGERLP